MLGKNREIRAMASLKCEKIDALLDIRVLPMMRVGPMIAYWKKKGSILVGRGRQGGYEDSE